MPLPAPKAFDCTPKSLMASYPCLACLSEKEMLAVIVGILAIGVDKTVSQAMTNGACFSCLSKKQMLQALVTMLGNDILGASVSAQDVVNQMHCLVCANEKELLAAILKLYCDDYILSTRAVL